MTDTHCHLADEAFDADRDDVVARAVAAGVSRMVVCCCHEREFPTIADLCRHHEGTLLPTLGLHPEDMAADVDVQLATLHAMLDLHASEVAAIGEIGLDLHWDTSRLDDQRRVLTTQVSWALDYDLPVLVHVRDAMDEWLDLLPALAREADRRGRRLRGIMHCYSGTAEQARDIMRHGDFYFGVGGTLTYKRSAVPDVVRSIGLGRLVVETDAPYLAPVPHRGRRNEPSFTATTAEALAGVLGTSVGDIETTTEANVAAIFRDRL